MKATSLMWLTTGMAMMATVSYAKQVSISRASDLSDASHHPATRPNEGNLGNLNGTVKFIGQAPKNHSVNMAADPLCMKMHPTPGTTEEVVTGSENGIANVLVYISEGLDGRTFDPPKQAAVIEQKGCQYHPHVIAVLAGQKILVENSDPTTHNIHPLPANNREWNQFQAQGVPPLEATFGREEIAIPVRCNVHPWMRGYIAVLKNPYFAVTDVDGSFTLNNIPPDSYTVRAWHEKLGTQTEKVTIAPNQVTRVEFTFKLNGT